MKRIFIHWRQMYTRIALKHPEFTYSACGPFTKHCERIQNFRETSNSKYLYRNASEKVCFAHDAAYSNIKYLAKGTISDQILKDRAYEIVQNHKSDGHQKALPSMVYKFFDKKTRSAVSVNEKLPEELHKVEIKKIEKQNRFNLKKIFVHSLHLR